MHLCIHIPTTPVTTLYTVYTPVIPVYSGVFGGVYITVQAVSGHTGVMTVSELWRTGVQCGVNTAAYSLRPSCNQTNQYNCRIQEVPT